MIARAVISAPMSAFLPPHIVASNFRRYERNTLLGFVDLTLLDFGLIIRDCPVHRKGDAGWVAMPGRPIIDSAATPASQPKPAPKPTPPPPTSADANDFFNDSIPF